MFNIVVRLHNSSKDFVIDYDRYRTGYEKKFVKESAFHLRWCMTSYCEISKRKIQGRYDARFEHVLPNGTLPWKATSAMGTATTAILKQENIDDDEDGKFGMQTASLMVFTIRSGVDRFLFYLLDLFYTYTEYKLPS